ncbi:ABC transporter ATP-binding protein/permease [Prosthecochloris sp. SCSIO W1101]|uniref:ABC transporter ATP-binding protein n=1 Tax=Prosthecochloris sp. SCSIO W1101 TaxID=2992242 RepID=UPI00223CD073|nr:ABC transporter ATP-binding protein [Prosthecochloris sp. SCSIO W1101]UZJ41108.1 ABC transporter ATP-binding protein/permease [Prosthecochloris sp. SCSIO W1101]
MNILIVRILRYLAPSRWKIVLVVFMSMLTSLFGVVSIYSVLPLLNAIFTADKTVVTPAVSGENAVMDNAVNSKEAEGASLIDTGKLQEQLINTFQQIFHAETKQRTLLNICLFLMAAFALKNLFLYINKQIIYRVQTKATKDLRDDVFHSIIEMHLDYFNNQRVGGLMNHVYNDVQSVQGSISSTFINFIQNPFSIFVYVGVLFVLSWKLTLFAFAVSIVIFFVIRIIGRRIKKLSKVLRQRMGDMNSVLQEKFSGIKVIKSSGFEDVEIGRFKSFTSDFRRLNLRIFRLKNIIGPLNETLMVMAVAMVLWFGGLQVFEGVMTANELIVFAFSLYSAMGPIKMLGEANTKIQSGMASAERLFEVIDAMPEVKNGTRSITGFSRSIKFEDVSFRYRKDPGAPNVLDHVSFEIKKGEMVALVGQSGSGKSTAVDLLLRFYDVDSGRITIDGIDIREFDYKQLRRMIGVVSQEVILFNDTIEQNIAYGIRGEAVFEQVRAAAVRANANKFIEEKPLGYETVIGDRGVQLSGGQRQRLAIARAMVKNPGLLVFDEATSALDNESEKVVQDAIDNALENRTALVVAHRLSTVKNADRIIVLDKGRIAESGGHKELLSKNGLYKMYYDIQFAGKLKKE